MKKKKYLRKSEFRNYINPKYLSKSKLPHPAYISGRRKNNYKFNVITHSKTFFGSPTTLLSENPNRNKRKNVDKRKSRISVAMWENKNSFSSEKLTGWRFSKKDKKLIKKKNKNI